MIEASARYVPHVAVLLAFTAALSLVHTRRALDVEDCTNPAALFPASTAPQGETPHHLGYDAAVGERGRWMEGSTTAAGGLRLEYRIMRSYQPRRIYHRPGRRLISNSRSLDDQVERLPAGEEEIPIHRLRFEEGSRRAGPHLVAAYLLVYHDEAVANPYLAQFAAAPSELVSGRRPMTLYLIHTMAPEAQQAQAEEATSAWLLERWRTHRAACAPTETAGR